MRRLFLVLALLTLPSDFFQLSRTLPGYLCMNCHALERSPEKLVADLDTVWVPDNFTTIQEAINNVNEGGTIYIRNGSYGEYVVVGKAVSLIGENEVSIGQIAPSESTLFTITANNVRVQNLQMSIGSHGYGGRTCARVLNAENITIMGCNLEAYRSIGLSITDSQNVTLRDNSIKWLRISNTNNATVCQNAVSIPWMYCMGSDLENVSCSHFVGNTLSGGNPPLSLPSRFNYLHDCTLYNNNLQGDFDFINMANNSWDNGYPSGGNCWTSYQGPDVYSGPDQNETHGDRIVDTPYSIDENNQDHYPLTEPRSSYPLLPVARFALSPSSNLTAGTPTIFDSSHSLLGWNGTDNTPIVEYCWDFGDGNKTTATTPVTVHTYSYPCVPNMVLTIVDSDGLNSSLSLTELVKMPVFVSISTSLASTVIGYTVGINGTLNDVYGRTMKGALIVLQYTFEGTGAWFPISSDTTDDLGQYQIQWTPSATGYFTIKAEWTGNATHIRAENTITLSSTQHQDQYISVESNSTISTLAFNTTSWELSFAASGQGGTRGYAKVTAAKSLVANVTKIRVYLDGNQSEYSMTPTNDSWLLSFDYSHSIRQIIVDFGTDIVPEFPSFFILLILMTATLLAIIVYKRKHELKVDRGQSCTDLLSFRGYS